MLGFCFVRYFCAFNTPKRSRCADISYAGHQRHGAETMSLMRCAFPATLLACGDTGDTAVVCSAAQQSRGASCWAEPGDRTRSSPGLTPVPWQRCRTARPHRAGDTWRCHCERAGCAGGFRSFVQGPEHPDMARKAGDPQALQSPLPLWHSSGWASQSTPSWVWDLPLPPAQPPLAQTAN